MYCVNCGVELEKSETHCPLCGIRAWHPEFSEERSAPLFPNEERQYRVNRHGLRIVITAGLLLAMVVCLLCDIQLGGGISWAGYAVGGILIFYGMFLLPGWFREPNPVFLTLLVFLLIHVYLLYISMVTEGGWYLSFGLPVAGVVGLLSTTVAGLLRYIARGAVYVVGGAIMALGAFMPVMGFLLNLTFFQPGFAFWSLYPGVSLVLAGVTLIFLGLCRPARQAVHRKFFI